MQHKRGSNNIKRVIFKTIQSFSITSIKAQFWMFSFICLFNHFLRYINTMY